MSDIGTIRIDLTTGSLCLRIDGKASNQVSVKPITINPGTLGSVTFDVENSCTNDATMDLSVDNLPDGVSILFTKDTTEISFPYTVPSETTETITININVDSDVSPGAKYYIYLNFVTGE